MNKDFVPAPGGSLRPAADLAAYGVSVESREKQAVKYAAAKALFQAGLESWTGSRRAPIDLRIAARKFHQAAALGHKKSAFAFAMMIYDGVYNTGFEFLDDGGGPLSAASARYSKMDEVAVVSVIKPFIDWSHEQANAGDALCQWALGLLYLRGDGVQESSAQSETWFRRSATGGYAPAQLLVAEMFAGSDSDKMRLILKAAGQGHPLASFKVGWCYSRGQGGLKQDYLQAVKWFQVAAAGGVVTASYQLAWIYAHGLGCERNPAEALPWLRKSADSGHDESRAMLSVLLDSGIGGIADPQQAARYRDAAGSKLAAAYFKIGLTHSSDNFTRLDYTSAAGWYRRAAELGHDHAQFCLGDLYERGAGVPQNMHQARHWYERAASLGHPGAAERCKEAVPDPPQAPIEQTTGPDMLEDLFQRARAHEIGDGVAQSPTEAALLYRLAAERGHTEAQAALGILLAYGRGVPEDGMEAAVWLERAAQKGHVDSQYNLALQSQKGLGVPVDPEKAFKWYLKTAEQGLSDAQFKVGVACEFGNGTIKDHSKAVFWYQKAADQGYPYAQYNLGLSYARAKGVEQDIPCAMSWYLKAAEQGLDRAQHNVGIGYRDGWGLPKNVTKSLYWLTKAAEQEYANSQYALALLLASAYDEGSAIPTDINKSRDWAKRAADNGHPEAKTLVAASKLGEQS